MRTLLVLAQHPELADAIRSGLADTYRILQRGTIEDAEPLLVHSLVDACVVDVEHSQVQGLWVVEKLRRIAPKCPLILFTGALPWQWEEEAYLLGVTHILAKPVRTRLLSTLLDRIWPDPNGPIPVQTNLPLPLPEPVRPAESGSLAPATAHTLVVLRDFSTILTHSLNAEGILKQFLLLLREILSINRAAIFLRQPGAVFGGAAEAENARRLGVASSVGLPPTLLQHFELSFDTGIGAHVFRQGRILRRNAEETRNDLASQKEFELLGAQVAVPILDRETILGVAVFDRRVTGEPLVNAELELIFHLLEQLGLAIKNIWLHDQLAGNHQMMADILRELSSACVVVSRDLAILHANKTARKYFARPERRGADLEFSDLPHDLGAKIYQVLKTGSGLASFKYEPPDSPGTVYNVNIVPFQRSDPGLPASALMMVEDLTQTQQLQRLELETAGLRQLKTMADRLTHEMGNAMVRLSTYQQLLAEKLTKKTVDVDFLKIMERDWADDVKRVTRLISQMRYLNVDTLASEDSFPLAPLIEEAYQEARKYQTVKSAQIKYEPAGDPVVVQGDRTALRHAFAELLLNALQANPSDPKIGVRLDSESNGSNMPALHIEVRDNGTGFEPEAAQKAFAPFFTTRNVGLGLGLTVSRKIIETHHGKLEIVKPKTGQAGVLRVSLPLTHTVATTE
jgi:nitrogen-specific signal transduction histidine kinase